MYSQKIKIRKSIRKSSLENLIKELEEERDKLLKEIGNTNSVLIMEESSNVQLEDKITFLQNQLSDEKLLIVILTKSLEGCRQRLKIT